MESQASSQLSSDGPLRILLNGHTPTGDDLHHPALINYGHFTSMQVRSGKVRGLHLHLERIERSHRELFGHGIDLDHARDLMRLAADGMPDSYLRTTFFEQNPGQLSVMTVQRPPVAANTEPVSLLPVEYQRPVAHLKHVGTFCKIFHAVQAERAGFDDALHISFDGFISETTGENIGFLRRHSGGMADAALASRRHMASPRDGSDYQQIAFREGAGEPQGRRPIHRRVPYELGGCVARWSDWDGADGRRDADRH